jgi:D-3-phosphoglycerate dehydrogenase
MKIAVTSKTLSNRPEFVTWLQDHFKEVKLNQDDKLFDDKLVKFLSDVDYVILGTEPFHKDIIKNIPNIKAVFKYGVGIDNIDFFECGKHNLPVYYRKGTNSNAVAEITLSYIIQLLRNQHISFSAAKAGIWNKQVGMELSDATVGVVGVGHVGSTIINKLINHFVGKLLWNDKKFDTQSISPNQCIDIKTLMSTSDLVTIHIDNEDRMNTNFFDDEKLSWLKDGAYLVNTARGSILDYEALEKHLPRLGGVALDVYPHEPDIPEFLINSDKVILSCHICGSSLTGLRNGENFIKDKIKDIIFS